MIDLTVFGSCKHCLIFSKEGIHYCRKKEKTAFIRYKDLINQRVETTSYKVLLDDLAIDLSGSQLKPIEVASMVVFLRHRLLPENVSGEAAHMGELIAADSKDERFSSGFPDQRPNTFPEYMAWIFGPYIRKQKVYATPGIPQKIEANARKLGYIGQDEPILALLDFTIIGTGDKYLLFTDKALHFRESYSSRFRLPCTAFRRLEFKKNAYKEIAIGPSILIDIATCSLKWYHICAILDAVQYYLGTIRFNEPVFNTPPDAPIRCPRCRSANLAFYTEKSSGFLWGSLTAVLGGGPLVSALVADQMKSK